MEKIKVSELFYSLQGEGKFTGVPSIFLRTFGCNFKCPSFGLPHGEKTSEVATVIANISKYAKYDDLPLVSTGCDSYAAVYPEFKHLSPMMTVDAIVDSIMSKLPNNEWGDVHLVITGGEPLLGWQRAYIGLLSHPKMQQLTNITFETNGTQAINADLAQFLIEWQQTVVNHHKREVTFSVSAKLSCSGELASDALRPIVVRDYEEVGPTYLKFVIATDKDAEEALEAVDIFRATGFTGYVYLMPIGGVESVYTMNNRTVADLATKHGLRYSDRLQVQLWKNAWAT